MKQRRAIKFILCTRFVVHRGGTVQFNFLSCCRLIPVLRHPPSTATNNDLRFLRFSLLRPLSHWFSSVTSTHSFSLLGGEDKFQANERRWFISGCVGVDNAQTPDGWTWNVTKLSLSESTLCGERGLSTPPEFQSQETQP